MAPVFESVLSFADVPITDVGVDTPLFLEAADGVVKIFELLGVGIFSFLQVDLRNNIKGVRSAYEANQRQCESLERLVYSETAKHHDGIGCLRRLIRGLLLTCRSLKYSRANKNEEIQVSFRRSYDDVLKRHHGLAVRTAVSLVLKACPSRKDFYNRIAEGGCQEKLQTKLDHWLDALDIIVERMCVFYEQGGFGKI